MQKEDTRFNRENIDRLLYYPKDSAFMKFFKNFIVVPVLDFFPIYLLFLWVDLYLVTKFDFILFLILFEVFAVLSIFWLYLVFVKYYFIKTNKYKINVQHLNKPFKFIFLSDIHIGKSYYGTDILRLKRIINKINNLNLDLVVIGGDFICEKIDKDLLLQLEKIKAKHKIAVYGNHDADYLEDDKVKKHPQEFLNIIKKTGFQVLINEGELIEIDEKKVYFAGIPDLYSRKFDVNKAFEKAPKGVTKVLLSHNPDILDFIENKDDIDLVLSGHNHSGMIFFKPFGALLPMPSKYRWLTKGIFEIGEKTKLFLSQGIGYSTTRLRIGTESELCVIELY